MEKLLKEDIRVMLVDDEEAFIDTMSKRLERQGFNVSQAEDASQAIAKLEADPVDVVILDINMPGMDGIQCLKHIKANFHGVEVIMLTGRPDVNSAVESMHSGAFDFQVKPASFELLMTKIQDAAVAARLDHRAVRSDVPTDDPK